MKTNKFTLKTLEVIKKASQKIIDISDKGIAKTEQNIALHNELVSEKSYCITFKSDVEPFNILFKGNWKELSAKLLELKQDNYTDITFSVKQD